MNYSLLSNHRSKLMAIAMIWIACFHASFWLDNKLLSFIKSNGFGGVDIFVFLFGFGVYYSLTKNKNISVFKFYRNRLLRLLPYVIPVLVVYCIYNSYDIYTSILYVLLLDFWKSGNTTLWYFPAMIAFIIISPIVFYSLEKDLKNTFVYSIIICIIAFVFYKDTTQMIFGSRLPIFIMGFVYGKASMEQKLIKIKDIVLHVIFLFIGLYLLYYNYHHFGSYMWSHGLYWYPFILIAPSLCFILSIIFNVIDKISALNLICKILNNLGKITLEFYLFHELMIKIIDNLVFIPGDYYGIIRNTATAIITLVIAYTYHTTIKHYINKFKN